MRLSVILAVIWLLFKLVMLQMGYESERAGVIINVLFLVIIIFLSIRNLRRDISFFPMLKAGMRPAAVYILLICVAIFIYYKWMDPGYMLGVTETNLEAIEKGIEAEGGWKQYAKNHAPMNADSQEEFMTEQKEGFEMIFSPFARASQSLLALTMLALLYSLMMIGVYKVARKVIK